MRERRIKIIIYTAKIFFSNDATQETKPHKKEKISEKIKKNTVEHINQPKAVSTLLFLPASALCVCNITLRSCLISIRLSTHLSFSLSL